MKKKNGFNIMLFVLIINLFFTISCIYNSNHSASGVLLKTDLDFSKMSEISGMHKAFLAYFADSGAMLRDNAYPLVSKDSLISLFSRRSDTTFILSWKPVYEKIAKSGDLGYTYGFYKRTIKSTGAVSRGTYLTIWEKQKDGNWKFVMDTGTEGLPGDIK
jgi:ketosteroid isomerase-like protein